MKDTSSKIKFSIIICCFNVAGVVQAAVESAVNQTFKNIEIICVDDGSADGTNELLKELQKKFRQVRLICSENNESLHMSRLKAAEAAEGEYCFFLDADDTLVPDACMKLAEVLEKNDVDIAGFNTKLVLSGCEDYKDTINFSEHIKAFEGKLTGKELFQKIFIQEKRWFQVCTKCFKTTLLKEACRRAERFYSNYSEDYYLTFIAVSLAKNYIGISDRLYNYTFGTGMSNINGYTYSKAVRMIGSGNASSNAVIRYAGKYALPKAYAEAAEDHRKQLAIQLGNFISRLEVHERKKAFQELKKTFGCGFMADDVISKAKESGHLPDIDIRSLFETKRDGIDRIALLCGDQKDQEDRLFCGELKEAFINAGFDAAELKDLSELAKADGAFDLPDMIVYMPGLNDNDTVNMVKARAAGIYFVMYMKKSLCGRIGKENNLYSQEMKLYAGADGVICPTAADEEIIKRAGIPACRFEKRIPFKEGRVISSLKRPDIMWTGKLDDPDNNLMDAFEILREVRKACSEARLIVFGRSADESFQSRIDREISFQDLERAVIFVEDETRFAEYASGASVYLSTASCSALDAGFAKAISFGLPIVAYEIPGNPFLEDVNISISVGSGDRLAAINAVTALFEHPEIKAFLSRNAGSWVQKDKSGDITERLRSFCASVKNEVQTGGKNDHISEVCDVLLKVIDRLTEQNRIDKEYLMHQIKE